ncbi:MAG TPA: protein kinase [Polyangiaceae bacterium]|nr:protein kinase [Polyangiaceae bacterium]
MTAGAMSVGPGDRIADRYRIEAWIGQGNMAVVFRARHEGTGRLCALKVVHHHLAARQEIIELFLREARVGSRIGQSPYIVDVLDAGVDQARALPFLAMELLQGQTLDVQIREHGPLDSATVRLLFEQLAEALDQAHAAGVVHRDLKPGNLFLTRDKRGKPCLKIVDFGIAKVLEQEAQRTATQVGSPAYAAPEQMGPTLRRLAEKQGITIAQGISPATDVWALGLIAYELLTGLGGGQYWSQFDTVNDLVMRVVFETPEPPTVRAGPRAFLLPPGFDDWFLRCLRKNAAERWASAGQAVQAIIPLLDGTALENLPTRKLPSRAEIEAMVSVLSNPTGRAPLPSEPDPGATPAPVDETRSPFALPATVKLTREMLQGVQPPTTTPLPYPIPPPAPSEPALPAPMTAAPLAEPQPPGLVGSDVGVAGTRREPARGSLHPRVVLVAALSALLVVGVGLLVIWPTSGRLRIDVRTAGGAPVEKAEVYVDGQKRCESAPCEVEDLSPGLKAIKAITADMRVAGPINEAIEAGEEKTITLTLGAASTPSPQEARAQAAPTPAEPAEPRPTEPKEPAAPTPGIPTGAPTPAPTIPKAPEKPTRLSMNSIPATKVYLDGQYQGYTPKVNVLVAPGRHKVEFVHPSLGKKTLTVNVKPGETGTALTRFK